MAAGRYGGRQERSGIRVGLPRDAAPRHGRGPSQTSAPTGGGWDVSAEDERRHVERLAVARLFDHMEQEPPRAYRDDAYRDAPRIEHAARLRFSISAGSASALAVGGILSLLVIFTTGFLSAVLIFGEPDPGGEIAIRTGPATSVGQGSILPSAEAGRGTLPPPAPEIVAAEAARERALAAPEPTHAPTSPASVPPVSETVVPAPPVLTEQPIDSGSIVPPPVSDKPVGLAPIVTAARIFPPAKPALPERQVAAAGPSALDGPGGNYSLQFGAFRDRANAEALVRELSGVVRAGIVKETGAAGAVLFFVRAGAFDTRAAALEAVAVLRRDVGIVTFVHANLRTG